MHDMKIQAGIFNACVPRGISISNGCQIDYFVLHRSRLC